MTLFVKTQLEPIRTIATGEWRESA